jgi:putative transposase
MPNHWHFVVYPTDDGQVTRFFRWLTHTHAMRAITHRRVMGTGPLYQGRFKTLPVEQDEHLATLLRYVQRNPLRARLVQKSRQWQWSGQRARQSNDESMRSLLYPWPIDTPANWDKWVDTPQTSAEVNAIRNHIRRGRPFGSPNWVQSIARKLDMQWTLRPRGRPPIAGNGQKELRPNPVRHTCCCLESGG